MLKNLITVSLLSAALAGVVGCGASNPPMISEGHIKSEVSDKADIPLPVTQSPILPKPAQRPRLETYTVIVNQVPVRELLFSMARDAKLNLDIDNDIEGKVTMNAIDQTLPQILERLTRQAAINYTLKDDTLHVSADKPYLRLYDVNYLNMSRESSDLVEISTEISSTASSAEGGSSGGNNSSSTVANESSNKFWETLVLNFTSVIGESAGSKAGEGSENIIVNRETGIIGVRATRRQHEQILELLDRVVGSAQRQVMIEATIAEVTLSDRYQAGIDWSLITETDALGDATKSVSQSVLGGALGGAPVFQAAVSSTPGGNNLTATLKALETFGDVKVLSSPKVMALNNQTAMLKVVDNEVYFSIEVGESTTTDNEFIRGAVSTTISTVPVGFVMSVLPYIDSNDVVTLHVRPTISRVIGTAKDPNPDLALADVENLVPIIQVREIESILKVSSGDTAVIGGLMQDEVNKIRSGVPLLSSIPFLGGLFSYQDDEYVKSELVIFIRPIVIHDASLTGDLSEYRKYLLDDPDASQSMQH